MFVFLLGDKFKKKLEKTVLLSIQIILGTFKL